MAASSFVSLPFKLEKEAKAFTDDDNRYPESLVRHFLKEFTSKDDRVFDPFAGLGTTLFVCEEMKRIPYGIEADRKRFEWTAGQLENWTHLLWEDSAKMLDLGFPKMDFAITSPPYMPKHHQWNPLYGGDPKKAGYNKYLRRMQYIFKQLSQLMKRNARVVVQVDNLRQKSFTPLVRDIGHVISKSMRMDDEIIIQWENAPKDYPYTHCLVFKNTQQ